MPDRYQPFLHLYPDLPAVLLMVERPRLFLRGLPGLPVEHADRRVDHRGLNADLCPWLHLEDSRPESGSNHAGGGTQAVLGPRTVDRHVRLGRLLGRQLLYRAGRDVAPDGDPRYGLYAEPHYRVLSQLPDLHHHRDQRLHVGQDSNPPVFESALPAVYSDSRRPCDDLCDCGAERVGPHLLDHGGAVCGAVALGLRHAWLVPFWRLWRGGGYVPTHR